MAMFVKPPSPRRKPGYSAFQCRLGLLCSYYCPSGEWSGKQIMMLEDLLKEKRKEINALADRHGARNVRVFGSVATGEAGPESDIDLLVKMDDDRSLLDVSALALDLRTLMGVKVDIVSEDAIYWLLRRKILKEARPL